MGICCPRLCTTGVAGSVSLVNVNSIFTQKKKKTRLINSIEYTKSTKVV